MNPQDKLILIVDDDDDFRTILRHILLRVGYRVTEAANGTDGLDRFGREVPDLVLLDVSMPDMDGLEVCRRIRASKQRANTPVLMITVRSQLSSVAEGLQAGATDYVLKPFEPEDLVARVAKALRAATGANA